MTKSQQTPGPEASNIRFVKHLRECPRNADAAPGDRLIYDYNVVIDGEHRATWSNEFHCRGYRLYDVANRPIGASQYDWRGRKVGSKAEFQAETERLLNEGQIPTLAEIEAYKAQQVAEQEAKNAAAAEAERIHQIKEAGPELLEAVKAFKEAVKKQYTREGSDVLHLVPGMLLFEPYEKACAVIAKATGQAA